MERDEEERPKRIRGVAALALSLLCFSLLAAWFVLEKLDSPKLEIDLTERTPTTVIGAEKGSLKIAVASMTSPQSTYIDYRWIIDQVVQEAGINGGMSISPSYAKVRKSLETGDVDVAFVCTGTFARMYGSKKIELLVQPQLTAGSDYCCVIIARTDLDANSMADLRGRSFAFSDPESNTGCFIPSLEISKRGWRPENYFGKILYTGSHDRSVQAVTGNHVDAAAVDKLVLDKLVARNKDLKNRFKIIWQSEKFGPPPVVVRSDLPEATKAALRTSLVELHRKPSAREHLARIGIDRFTLPNLEIYKDILELYQQGKEK